MSSGTGMRARDVVFNSAAAWVLGFVAGAALSLALKADEWIGGDTGVLADHLTEAAACGFALGLMFAVAFPTIEFARRRLGGAARSNSRS